MANFFPGGKFTAFDNSGRPLSGGKVYTYTAGTSNTVANYKASYTDSTGLTNNTNPVILDSAGRADIWLVGLYRVDVHDSNSAYLYHVDNVGGIAPETDVQSGAATYAVDTQSTDAYVIALTPAITSYTNGLTVKFKANTQNTGPASLNVNSLGAKSLLWRNSSNLPTGLIRSGQVVSACYETGSDGFHLLATPAPFRGARLEKTANFAVPNTTTTMVTWDVAAFDTSGFTNLTANTARISIGTTGVVNACLMAAANMATNNITTMELNIKKNDTSNVVWTKTGYTASNGHLAVFGMTGPIQVSASDFFTVDVRQQSATSSTNFLHSNGCFFSIVALDY